MITDEKLYGIAKKFGDNYTYKKIYEELKEVIKKVKQEERERIENIIDNHKIDYTTSRKRDIQSIKYKIIKAQGDDKNGKRNRVL